MLFTAQHWRTQPRDNMQQLTPKFWSSRTVFHAHLSGIHQLYLILIYNIMYLMVWRKKLFDIALKLFKSMQTKQGNRSTLN
jgi:hypothetical protein